MEEEKGRKRRTDAERLGGKLFFSKSLHSLVLQTFQRKVVRVSSQAG
jgi:hypothetical protein